MKVVTVAIAASLLPGISAQAKNGKGIQETLKVNCLVYEDGGDEPVFLADKSLELSEHSMEVIYESGPLRYVASYEDIGDDTAEKQFYAIGLMVEDASRDMRITSLSGTGKAWNLGAHLIPPFNLPHFDCTPDYPVPGEEKAAQRLRSRRSRTK